MTSSQSTGGSWTDKAPEREKRMWHLVNPNTELPTYAEGLRCTEGDLWWFPTLGWSVPCTNLCVTEEAAHKMALDGLRAQRKKLDAKIRRLERKGDSRAS